MCPLFLTLLVILTVTSMNWTEADGSYREAIERLHDNLTARGVSKWNLPPLLYNDYIFVEYRFSVVYISEVNDAKQTLQSKIFMTISWDDTALSWNTEDYANITSVMMPSNKIWYPKMSVSNLADNDNLCLNDHKTILLAYNGSLKMSTSCLVKTLCNFDMKYYPFDTQICTIVYELDGGDAFISAKPVLINLYLARTYNIYHNNGELKIIDTSVAVASYVQVMELQIIISRHSLFYVMCVILPMIATSVLTLLVFWIPLSSGEKIPYLVSIYVSTALFLNFIGDSLPRNTSNTNTPRMTVFLVFVIVECVLALVATVFVMRRYSEEQESVDRNKNNSSTETWNKALESCMGVTVDLVDKREHGCICKTTVKTVSKLFFGHKNSCKGNKLPATVLDKIFFLIFLCASVPFCVLVFIV